jgi:N-acetylglucosaminyldiphosphoundecaprenol N-acetyl-beta-D-mannosaminyltransferase
VNAPLPKTVHKPEVLSILGTPLDITDYDRLADFCRRIAGRPGTTTIEFANTQVVTMRRHKPEFRSLTDRCFDHFVPDGMPLVWCMNRLGAGLEDRVYGPTFLRHFISQTPKPFAHFFLGASESCGQRLVNEIRKWNADVHVTGTYHGVCHPNGTLADESIIDRVNQLSPDFLWIGLGTPKQQAFIDRYRSQLRRGVILSVGFAFDVNAGTKRDAPLWMQRRGLTWLFRMITEPGRLGPRYIQYNTLFLLYVMRHGLKPKNKTPP